MRRNSRSQRAGLISACLPVFAITLGRVQAPEEVLKSQVEALPVLPSTIAGGSDWMIRSPDSSPGLDRSRDGRELHLDNGIIRRTFRLEPGLATVGLRHLRSGVGFLRAVKAEGELTLSGETYPIGGLEGQPEKGYLREEWLDA